MSPLAASLGSVRSRRSCSASASADLASCTAAAMSPMAASLGSASSFERVLSGSLRVCCALVLRAPGSRRHSCQTCTSNSVRGCPRLTRIAQMDGSRNSSSMHAPMHGRMSPGSQVTSRSVGLQIQPQEHRGFVPGCGRVVGREARPSSSHACPPGLRTGLDRSNKRFEVPRPGRTSAVSYSGLNASGAGA